MCQNYKAKVNCLLYRIILVLFFLLNFARNFDRREEAALFHLNF